MRFVLLALAVVGVAVACTDDERSGVRRITIQPVAQTPGAPRFPAIRLEEGEHFEAFRRLLPRPLPGPVPYGLPDLTEETGARACASISLEIEFSNGEDVVYGDCDLPRAIEPSCAAVLRLVPREYDCSRRLRPLVSIAAGMEPRLRQSDIGRVVERELGRDPRLEMVAGVPNDLLACRFVAGCRPRRRGPVSRWVWFVVAYRAGGDETVVPPTYLVIEDRTGALLGTRQAD